ncbi:MAG: oxidoreductase, partial [Gammaproteobacteria bacterium]|nr:oxidoreductase [Gammaproteobacteria bacterium]
INVSAEIAQGGTIDFLLRHPNPIGRAMGVKWNGDRLVWGEALKRRLATLFTEAQYLRFETFCDWLPTDDCFVTLDRKVKDKWGVPVARVRVGYHRHDLTVGRYLGEKAERVLRQMAPATSAGA